MLLPKDPNDGKDLIMEIRGAAGGDEASLFAADLFSMYSKYAERQGWSIEVIDKNMTEVGDLKKLRLPSMAKTFGQSSSTKAEHTVFSEFR